MSSITPATRIAIVGAGLAGSMCARTLQAAGAEVMIYDKSRGAGGRCSTRRALINGREITFDHGAQYFTVRDPRLAPLLGSWIDSGTVAPWQAIIGTLDRGVIGPEGRGRRGSADSGDRRPVTPTRYVGVPGMSAIVKELQHDLDVHFDCRVAAIETDGNRFRLSAEAGAHRSLFDRPFDQVIVTAPPVQTAALLDAVEPALAASVRRARIAPCLATMVLFEDRVGFAGPHTLHDALSSDSRAVGGLFVRDSPISWAANQNTKPGRSEVEHWVLHASPEWSECHLEEDGDDVGALLIEAFADATGAPLPTVLHRATHRWRYASVETGGDAPFLWSQRGLGVCGDWCVGGRVEGALLSGRALAEHVLAESS